MARRHAAERAHATTRPLPANLLVGFPERSLKIHQAAELGLGAVQIKYHGRPTLKTGPGPIRELAGVVGAQPIDFGVIVTNTTFTPDAKWIADQHKALIHLKDIEALRRWLEDDFTDEAVWRDIPSVLELCPGVTVEIPHPC